MTIGALAGTLAESYVWEPRIVGLGGAWRTQPADEADGPVRMDVTDQEAVYASLIEMSSHIDRAEHSRLTTPPWSTSHSSSRAHARYNRLPQKRT